MTASGTKPIHYWTGRGTLCSLDNSVEQKPNHSTDKEAVTCQYCTFQMALNATAPYLAVRGR